MAAIKTITLFRSPWPLTGKPFGFVAQDHIADGRGLPGLDALGKWVMTLIDGLA